ncbi:MAG TPA: hypothetical protein GXX26_05390 [Clostridiaceae bacterium]|nr:hypothetical protein [Clostridiaceae bacterium]
MAQIAERAVNILITQMEQGYRVFSEKVPAAFIRDVTYPLPFGIESL